jgi:hypothetical protein
VVWGVVVDLSMWLEEVEMNWSMAGFLSTSFHSGRECDTNATTTDSEISTPKGRCEQMITGE